MGMSILIQVVTAAIAIGWTAGKARSTGRASMVEYPAPPDG
ncbi:MAG TPA: hypothetical protein VGB19_09025 [Actinomycetota bacterium]